jgi:lysophospholipase L1-like esterase
MLLSKNLQRCVVAIALLTIFSCKKDKMDLIGVIEIVSRGKGNPDSVPPPTPTPGSTWFVIMTGESNSGGIAKNSDATVAERASRSVVKIWNNDNGGFENLLIGTNNLLDHTGLTGTSYGTTTHSWELGLGNKVEEGVFATPLYLVKRGFGGSRLSEWNVGGTYMTKFTNTYNAAKAALEAAGVTQYNKAILYSHGINDAILGTSAATYKTQVIDHIANMRSVVGANTIVLMTRIMEPSYNSFNQKIDEICNELTNVFPIPTEDCGKEDANHWNYSGQKLIAYRMASALTINNNTYNDAVIVFDGNSLTKAASVNAYGNGLHYPDVVKLFRPFFKGTATFHNVAVDGQTNQQMASDIVSQVLPLYQPGKKCVYIPWECGNDLVFNGSAVESYNRFVAICQQVRAAGFKIIALTPTHREWNLSSTTPYGDTWAQYNAKIDTINGLIRANWSTFADKLADIAADSRLNTPTDLNWYHTDQVHHNGAGRTAIAAIVYQKLMEL